MTVSERLRLVQGLHSHAEMFGFDWNDDSDWTWHDVACKIADEIDAENEQLRKLAGALFDCSRDGLYTGELPCQWCDLRSSEVCEKMVCEKMAKELGVIE